MQLINTIFLTIPLFIAFSCTQEKSIQPETSHFEPVSALVKGSNEFSFSFYREIADKPGNLFVSPYSISSAFSMAAAGAQGKTADQMFETLKQYPATIEATAALNKELESPEGRSSNDSQLVIANAIWKQEGLNVLPSFQKSLKNDFGADLESVDFVSKPAEALKKINGWVTTKTQGKIKELISENDINQETRLAITSAVYFKGQWLYPFDEAATTDEPFYARAGESTPVKMMHNTESYYLYQDDKVDVVELPYLNESDKGAKLALYVVLPKEKEGLANLEKSLSLDKMYEWAEKSDFHRVWLSLPKFKVETSLDLSEPMIQLGMSDAFSKEADFSGITGQKDLYISKAVHKTFIQVDEKGTQAAAATGVMMSLTSMLEPEEPIRIAVDHPFFYFIKDLDTQTILFVGRVQQP